MHMIGHGPRARVILITLHRTFCASPLGATPEQRADSTDKFLVGGIKGMLAGVLFYVGALTVLRSGAASGFAPLLLAGFGSWLLVRP